MNVQKNLFSYIALFAVTTGLIVTAAQSYHSQAVGQAAATPEATSTTTAGQTIRLDDIHMVNEIEGRAVKHTGLFFNTILHTQDGGKTWTTIYGQADFTTTPEYPDCRLG